MNSIISLKVPSSKGVSLGLKWAWLKLVGGVSKKGDSSIKDGIIFNHLPKNDSIP